MNRKIAQLFVLAITILGLTACGPSAAEATMTGRGSCLPLESVQDPFIQGQALKLTAWQVFDPTTTLEYQTTHGLVLFQLEGQNIYSIYPSGKVNRDTVDDQKLIALSPTFTHSDGSVSQFGPIFFYRCGKTISFNTEMALREVIFSPPPDS